MIPHALPCFFIFCMENISSQNFLHFYCRQDIILIWSSDIQAVPVHLTTSCYCTYYKPFFPVEIHIKTCEVNARS